MLCQLLAELFFWTVRDDFPSAVRLRLSTYSYLLASRRGGEALSAVLPATWIGQSPVAARSRGLDRKVLWRMLSLHGGCVSSVWQRLVGAPPSAQRLRCCALGQRGAA